MSSYRKILYHLIFRTKSSRKSLSQESIKELFAYLMGFLQNKGCFLYRINSMEDHIHILCDLNPQIALSDFMRDLKTTSSIWLKQSGKFPAFDGWGEGYAAFTYAWKDKDMIVSYIRNQQEHHKLVTFEDELRTLLVEHGIDFDERYFP